MSHIFDALQKAAAEGANIEVPPALLATELLQAAERRAAAERAMERPETAVSTIAVGSETEPATGMAVFPEAPKAEDVETAQEAATDTPIQATDIDQFGQFQRLKVLVPPQSHLVCITDKESLAAEKFRFLGVRLRQLQQRRPLKKILITSTIPQEGKSLVAANLACTLARRTQQKVLLLDGDLRRPSLAQLFGLGKVPGISEWLQGDSGPMTSIYHLEGIGIWMLPAGSTPANALELMQSGKLSILMDQLSAWFDWIVIDSPPVLPLGDTSLWMRLADGILLVTRQGITDKTQLQRGLETLEPAKLLGALLNCSTNSDHSDYYYHYSRPTGVNPIADVKK